MTIALFLISIVLVYGYAYYIDYKRDKSVLKDITLVPKFLILCLILNLTNNLIRNILFKPSSYFQKFNSERIYLDLDTLPETWTTEETVFKSWFDYVKKNNTCVGITFLPRQSNKVYFRKRLDFEDGKLIRETNYYKHDSAEISKGYYFPSKEYFYDYTIKQEEKELSLNAINDTLRKWEAQE